MENEKGTFIIEGAFALTWHPEAGFSLLTPNGWQDSEEPVPDEVTALLACAGKLKNEPEFIKEMVAWMESKREMLSSDKAED